MLCIASQVAQRFEAEDARCAAQRMQDRHQRAQGRFIAWIGTAGDERGIDGIKAFREAAAKLLAKHGKLAFEFSINAHLLTRHAITIRPLCVSVKTLKKLPQDLQDAIVRAGKEAGAYGRQVESSEDQAKLDKYAKEGKLKQVPFTERAQMQKLVEPVMAAYAKEVGAEAIYNKINTLK